MEKKLIYGPLDYVGHEYDTYLFVAPVKFQNSIQGEFFVGAYVIRDVNTTRYKMHEVLTINKEDISPLKKETISKETAAPSDISSEKRILQPANTVNTETPEQLQISDDYMEAVESGNVEEENRLVNEYAKTKGYTIRAFHSTARGDRVGNVFRADRATSGPCLFFTPPLFRHNSTINSQIFAYFCKAKENKKIRKPFENKGFPNGAPAGTRFSAEKPRRLQHAAGMLLRAAFRVPFSEKTKKISSPERAN